MGRVHLSLGIHYSETSHNVIDHIIIGLIRVDILVSVFDFLFLDRFFAT